MSLSAASFWLSYTELRIAISEFLRSNDVVSRLSNNVGMAFIIFASKAFSAAL